MNSITNLPFLVQQIDSSDATFAIDGGQTTLNTSMNMKSLRSLNKEIVKKSSRIM